MEYESVVIWYKNIIEDFQKILNIVPYNSNNESVVIPRLSIIIIEACSLLDSCFKQLYGGSDKKININSYKKYYNDLLDLSSIRTLFFMEEGIVLQPFKEWEGTDDPASTFWWSSYNSLKHDRINKMNQSTLINAAYSLTALTQFLARNVTFFKPLYRHELIITNINPDLIYQKFNEFWENSYNEISFENELFLIPFGKNILNNSLNDINTNIIKSKKLKNYYAKWG